MAFTARYDYDGAFWPAFTRNLGMDSLEQSEWGFAFRRALQAFKLFSPPEHWMVNVFPVLYHSIVPERSLEDFALMVRALCDTVDIRNLDDHTLAEAIDSVVLPILLRRFVSGKESRAVAHELIRHVAEDFRLGVDLAEDTLRSRILMTMRAATETRLKAFGVRIQPLSWRWDFNNGRCGVWLSSNRSFDTAPIALEVDGHSVGVKSRRTLDSWELTAQMLSLPTSTAGKRGVVTSYDGHVLQVRVASAPLEAPCIFRSVANAGLFETSSAGISGDFAIAGTKNTRILRPLGEQILPLEILPTPLLRGAETAGLFSLSEGDTVWNGDRCVFSVRQATRPSVELRGRTSWVKISARGQIPVYCDSPRLELRSPEPESVFLLFEDHRSQPVSEVPFRETRQLRPETRNGKSYRTSITVNGRSAGTTAVEFIILPLRSELDEIEGRKLLNVFGQGTLTIGTRTIELRYAEPSPIYLSELYAAPEVYYDFQGDVHTLGYSGIRPTLWGFTHSSLNHALISTRLDTVITHPNLYVAGIPGDFVALKVNNKEISTSTIGSDGLARLSLTHCIPLARARDTLDVQLVTADFSANAITIVTSPHVGREDLVVSRDEIRGTVYLDSPVDELFLEACVFQQPWLPTRCIPLDGGARRWRLEATLPRQCWELSLTGQVQGARVSILDENGVWSRTVGKASDHRTAFDESLYTFLTSHDETDNFDALAAFPAVEIVRRCLTMLALTFTRYDRPRIARLLHFCTTLLNVRDIANIEDCLTTVKDQRIIQIAARAGLPIAAFQVLPFDAIRIENQPFARKTFTWFARAAATGGAKDERASLAAVLADFETHENPLIVNYARLLRQLRANETDIPDRLANIFQTHDMNEASLHAERFGEVNLWTDASPEQASVFALIVKRLWGLATISRRVHLLPTSAPVPTAVKLASSFIYDPIVGELMRLTLCWVDTNIKLRTQEYYS
jgi:hypothetical protein